MVMSQIKLTIMSKRLQVILQDPEYRDIQRVARTRHMTIAEWVRQTLDEACREEPLGNMQKKLETVRQSSEHQFPSGEIDQMLSEIEAGYLSGSQP